MFSYLPLLPLLTKYASLVSKEQALAPDLEALAEEATPHITALVEIWQKHLASIQAQEALSPQLNAFIAEAMPIIAAAR